MADDKTTPQKSTADIVSALKAKANDWTGKFGGKPNYNPHLAVAKYIRPIVDALSVEGAKLTDEIQKQISAIPAECPCIDKNWQPPVKEGAKPQATAAAVGAKNAQV